MPQGFQALLALLVLLPGFVSARISRSISAPSDQTDVERIIDALVFSFFIYILYLFLFGGSLPLDWIAQGGPADSTHFALHVRRWRLLYLCLAPVLFGVIWGSLQHRDAVLGQMRKWKLTNRTNDVSIWNARLRQHNGTVQVGMSDGRAIVGWLQQYSDVGEDRSLFFTRAAWVDESGKQTEIPGPGILLTDESDIHYIMFLDGPSGSRQEQFEVSSS